MTRLTLALLLTLLAIAPVASVAGVGAPPLAPTDAGGASDTPTATAEQTGTIVTIQANNTTRRLGLDTVERTNYTSPGMDLASTVAVTGQQIDEGLRSEYLSVRVEQAGSPSQRRAIADAEVERLDRSINQLRTREWGVLQLYGNGEISERELLHRLAVIHSQAVKLEAAATRLEQDGADFNTDEFRRRTTELQTPIRGRILDVMTGRANTPFRVHVSGSDQGVVLQALSESRFSRDYYREAVRLDNHEDGPYTLNLNDFLDLLNNQYPFVTSTPGDLGETSDGTNIYVNSHDQGEIRLYNDGRTEAVYREFQSLRLSDLPRGGVHTRSANGTTVSIQTTPNGGPARVVATNSLTGDTVAAEVYVDGNHVGRTGGGLWILQPSEEYTVSVRTPEGAINVSVHAPQETNNTSVSS